LFTQRLGWSSEEYAQIVGGPGLFLGLGGSVVGGLLADRVGHRRLAALGSVGLAAVWLVFAAFPSLWAYEVFVYGLFLLSPLFLATMTVSLFALCMDLSWPKIAATQFTAYMAVANLSTVFGAKLAPWVSKTFTDQGVYLFAAGVQLAITLVIPLIDPGETRRRLPPDDPPPPSKPAEPSDTTAELPRAIAKER
jgi:PAT family beta-lactamase induction signal transducer AmpG